MLKTQTLIRILLCLLLQYACTELTAQNTKLSKFSFSAEAIPYATFYGQAADGMQFSLGYKILKNKYDLVLSYGLNKFTYDMSGYLAPITVNGQPIVATYTSASIFMPESQRIGGASNKSLFEKLEKSGIKHYSSRDASCIRNYGSLEILRRHYFKQKWELEWGGWITNGCTES